MLVAAYHQLPLIQLWHGLPINREKVILFGSIVGEGFFHAGHTFQRTRDELFVHLLIVGFHVGKSNI